MTGVRRSALALALALVLTAAGCGDVGEPDLGVAPDTVPSDAAQVAPAPPEVASIEAPTGTVFPAQRTPTRPADFVPSVLVADGGGVHLLGGPALVTGVAVDRVRDDPTGGLVVEVPDDAGRRILWYPAASEASQVVSEGQDRLLDVAFIDGGVHAVVADADRVALLRLGEPDEQLLFDLEPETSVVSLSAAAGLYAVVVRDAECGTLEFRRPDGGFVSVGGVPAAPCETPGRPAYGLVALSPDGDTFAYTQRSFRSDGVVALTELVVRDLFGTELHRSTVGGEDQALLSLALDRTQVALLRSGPAPELVRIDLTRPTEVAVTPLDGARSASFTRVPGPER